MEEITRCGGFDRYILMTSPAKLMSDLGCALKREMCILLNDPDASLKNIRRHFAGSENKYGRAASNIYYEDLCHFTCPPHVARFINLSPFEGNLKSNNFIFCQFWLQSSSVTERHQS